MKFLKSGRFVLASLVSLALGLGLTACSSSYTIGFVYVLAAKNSPGQINAYKIDNQSGALTQLKESPYPSGGQQPVAAVASTNGKYLYVVHNVDNTVVEFIIGSDGKLYPQHTYNTPGSFPVSAALDPTGAYLLVADTLAPGFTLSNPGPGIVTVFPVSKTDGSLGTPTYAEVGTNPVSVFASPQISSDKSSDLVYVANYVNTGNCSVQGDTPVAAPCGEVLGLSLALSGGALTRVPSSVTAPNPQQAGIQPSAMAVDPKGLFLYITDATANQLIGYTIQSTGSLSPMLNGPFATGLSPRGIVIEPRGLFIYVSNYNANSLSTFQIDSHTGNPSGLAGSNVQTDAGPNCLAVEPARGKYLYISNNLGNTVTGEEINGSTGALLPIQNTPFTASGLPTCVAAVPNGSHPTQAVTP